MRTIEAHSALRGFLAAAAMAFAMVAPSPAAADAYPSAPVKMVIGFAPGGPTDVVARILAQRIGEKLGQPVIVDNRPGAGANIAAEAIAKANPDGYSVFYNTSSITIAPWTYGKVGYDPLKDFAPVLLTAEMPLVLAVPASLPVRTAKDLVELLKANPDKYNYGSSGTGAIEHLTSAQFASMFGLKAAHIPYKGTAPALVDLLAGRTHFMMTTINTALPHVRDGKLRALAVTSTKRSSALPDVPTVSEALGVPFQSSAWQGIVVPTGTPEPVVRKLNETINAVLQEEPIRHKLAAQGVDVLGGSADQYRAFIRSEHTRWAKVVKESGARAE